MKVPAGLKLECIEYTSLRRKTPRKSWRVTHIASGLGITRGSHEFKTRRAAVNFLAEVAPLADWRGGVRDLMGRIDPKIVEIRTRYYRAEYPRGC